VLGAALWGTDALFRRGLALELPASTVVALEHLILAVITLPVLLRGRHSFKELTAKQWTALIIIGVGASATATILFTAAFRYGDPTTPLLLQKLQPLVAIVGASLLLGERLLPRFGWFLLAGVGGAFLLAFPDPSGITVERMTPALLAIGAATLWGLGTVLGRMVLATLDRNTLTAARFAIGLPAAAILMVIVTDDTGIGTLDAGGWGTVALLALVPGLIAMLSYYRGLESTPASAATLGELAFPVSAATINYFAFGTTLTTSQWMGAALLVVTITTMSLLARSGNRAVGIVVPASS
jgi:DME family drug/metabolite transporter